MRFRGESERIGYFISGSGGEETAWRTARGYVVVRQRRMDIMATRWAHCVALVGNARMLMSPYRMLPSRSSTPPPQSYAPNV